MVKDKADLRQFLVQVGVAVALSFAGFFYSRLKGRDNYLQQPPQRRRSSADIGEGRARLRDDSCVVKTSASSGAVTSVSAERHEDRCMVRVPADNTPVVLSPGSSGRLSGDEASYLLPQFNDLVKEHHFNASGIGLSPKKDLETPSSDVETPKSFRSEKDDYTEEIKHLRNMVRMLRERERNLEAQLLEFYGLKEQETAMIELQNCLKINSMETKFLTLKIESLEADNKRLQSQVSDYAKVVVELDTARAKIRMLKKKLKFEAEQNREQILTLKEKVSRLQEEDQMAAATDADAQVNQQRLKELEVEADELRRSNLRLQLENSELAHQLDSAQIPANSVTVIEDPETEALRELGNHLRQQNEDLAKEVERLQEDRCTDVEELVYLRWVNACLRYELRNFQPPLGKTVARDLSKSLSPRSEEKVKKLILEYANTEGIEEKEMNLMDFESYQWPSSQASCITESTDFDDSFLSSKASGSRKKKFFKKLGRLLRVKDIHHQDNGSTLWSEDSDSLCGISCVSTITDTASDLQSNEALTPVLNLSRHSSRHSSQHSMDFQRMKSPKMDDMKDMKSSQRNSNVGSSFGCRRASWSGDFSLERQGEQYSSSLEKAELVKFAEVLKDSGGEIGSSSRTGIPHRKSASHSSFETLWHKTTG